LATVTQRIKTKLLSTTSPCQYGALCVGLIKGVNMDEITIRLHIEPLDEGGFVATSPDVPGLVAEGRTVTEATEIAQGLARKIVESCLDHGDPLPPALSHIASGSIDLLIPVAVR
jgi:antitoxin HicB